MKNLLKLFTRTLLIAFLFAFSGHLLAQESKVMEITKDVYCFVGAHGYNSVFIVSTKGVIVIEPVNTAHAKELLKAIKGVTSQPVKYLHYSHNHWDHAGGGEVFEELGVKSLVHYEAMEWMKENPHKDMRVPDRSWAGNIKKITYGDKKLELHYLRNSHGLGMTVFFLPKEKLVYIADLITPDRVIFSIVPDFNINGTVRAIEAIEALNFETAIFSHGRYIGTRKDVTMAREYIQDVQAAVKAEFAKGTNFMEIPYVVKVPKYEHWGMYDKWLSYNVWRIMLDMYMGPYPWRYEPNLQKPAFE